MKKIIYLVLLFAAVMFAQSAGKISPSLISKMAEKNIDEKVLVWVFFSDKGNEIDNYFASPVTVVSEKSLNRRIKNGAAKGSVIDFTDLPVNANYINEIEQAGFDLKNKSRWFNGISGYTSIENISKLALMPFVQKIDLVYGFKKDYNVNDIDKPQGLEKNVQPEGVLLFNYGNSFTQLQQINVPALHNLGYYGQGVTICVMDAGFNRLTHESFSTMNIIAAWDFVNGDANVGDENDMGSGTHGTQTLSTIGGFKDGKLLGPAFGADYILAKTENTDSETPIEEDNWVAAMEWADSIGVDVTSTSLGYLSMDPGFPGYTWQDMDGNTTIITKGADLAAHKGIIVVNSAGNEGYNGTPNTLSAPADGDSVIAVGAVYSSGTRVGFSSYGPTVDGRIKPDIMAMGSEVYVASPSSNTGYTYASGTSFSCPLAAGVAALVLAYNPNLTPMQVRDALRLTASKATNPDNLLGWGIVNAVNAMNYFPLPVELTSFEAAAINENVVLKWSTATESNNRGFEIQRSGAAKKWQTIGFKDGKGTTSSKTDYTFTDKNYETGKNYYRLKQLDFSGNFEYSGEVLVDIKGITEYALFPNYPNPFNPSTNIKFTLPEKSAVSLKLYNILGSEIRTLIDQTMDSGTHSFILEAGDLSTGIYFVTLKAGSFKKTIKINLLK